MIKNPRGAGRKRIYPAETKPTSIRLTIEDKTYIVRNFGSVQKFLIKMIAKCRNDDDVSQIKKGIVFFKKK